METASDRLMGAIEEQWKLDQLTDKQRKVLDIIKNNPGVQNSEETFLEAVWKVEGWDDTKSLYWNLSRVSHPETLSRIRRTLHEKGLITYSKKADKARMQAYREATEQYSKRNITAEIVQPKLKLVDGEWVTEL